MFNKLASRNFFELKILWTKIVTFYFIFIVIILYPKCIIKYCEEFEREVCNNCLHWQKKYWWIISRVYKLPRKILRWGWYKKNPFLWILWSVLRSALPNADLKFEDSVKDCLFYFLCNTHLCPFFRFFIILHTIRSNQE